MNFFKKINLSNTLLILFVGLIVRLIFTWFIAKHYYGIDYFYCQGDTGAWARSFQNWLYKGEYSFEIGVEYSQFARMPGYSFFLGIFYLICNEDWTIAYKLCAYTQIFIDVFSIYLVKIIAQKVYNNTSTSSISAWLLALYPFAIVWSPVCYSETLSLNLLLISIWFYVTKSDKKYSLFFCAFFIALGALVRPQIAIMFPVYGLLLLVEKTNIKYKLKQLAIYGFTVLVVFGVWPARNYLNFKKVVIMQDLRGTPNWHGEVLAFTSFIYSCQADWEPQFTQIVQNKPLSFPKNFSGSKQDSIKLLHTFELCKTHSPSFSNWRGYWQHKYITDTTKTDSIVNAFNELRTSQIKNNPFTFYIVLPLKNLKKAIFKSTLYDTKSFTRKLASYLFYYRTLMILIGIFGCIMMMKNTLLKPFSLLFIGYWFFLYLALCAGTGPMFRNIEVRYFMHTDVVLLIPAAFALSNIYSTFYRKKLIIKNETN